MKIGRINRMNMEPDPSGGSSTIDSKSKEFQNQIASAQNRLKDLASDHKLNDEEKEKKRKEIQQKITDLNNQLRQHQIEKRREQQEKADRADATKLQQEAAAQEETAEGMSNVGMKAIISANAAINHAKAQGNMALATENRARALQTEISQDARYGKDTGQKQKELDKLEQKAVKIKGAKMSYLSKAAREMRIAAEKERDADKKTNKDKSNFSVNPTSAPLHSDTKKKTDIYIKGQMFSNVDFHF